MIKEDFWGAYFRVMTWKEQLDAFARSLGFKDAIAVPRDERDLFQELFEEDERKKILRGRDVEDG